MAHLKAFLQRKNIFARRSTILAFLGTLTDVLPAATHADYVDSFRMKLMSVSNRKGSRPINRFSGLLACSKLNQSVMMKKAW